MELKLNTRRIFFIGFAFFAILMLWQVHLYYTPLYIQRLLENHFGDSGDGGFLGITGIIMAIDNVFAILLLPLFGMWSDKTRNRLGKRMTFILVGGILSVILFPLIAVMFIINSFWWFVVMVTLMKIAMNVWRSPAVALMPDITPKPLRAKANAIVNFVGYIGAILGLLLTTIFVFRVDNTDPQSMSTIPFFITALVMLGIIVTMLIKFKENKVLEEMRPAMERGEELSETVERVKEDKPLSKRDKVNLWIVMGAVFMCWFAFNALQTFGSTYGQRELGTDQWGLLGIALGAASLITFMPSIKLTKKIGRKNSVMLGLGFVIVSLFVANFIPNIWGLIPIFAVSGAGWAIINVSAFPMVVEMASSKNIGKITGIYYIASQSAQAITSIVAGFVFDWIGIGFFWWYAVIFMSAALVLCFFFKPRKVTIEPTESMDAEQEAPTTVIPTELNKETHDERTIN
ncbi:MAG: MFS transporter [Firmicutes bacterium]|nr:MFS transporter [Bacillota bacterium]